PRQTIPLAAGGLLAAGLVALAAAGDGEQAPTAAPQTSGGVRQAPRHLIWVSLDTTRPDALGAYGNQWIATPAFDELATRGVLFENHLVTTPTTLPSHVSQFTGSYPYRHGVKSNGFVVPDDNLMLAEILTAAGFATAGFPAAHPLSR